MIRHTVLFLMLLSIYGWGFSYDTPLLQISAKLFPKVILMEKSSKERMGNEINLLIVATEQNNETAKRFSDMVQVQYPDGINNRPIKCAIVSPKEFTLPKNTDAVILMLSTDDARISPILRSTYENKILSFSMDPALLRNGTAVSLYIGKSVKPYINVATLKTVPFNFEYGFLKLCVAYGNPSE